MNDDATYTDDRPAILPPETEEEARDTEPEPVVSTVAGEGGK